MTYIKRKIRHGKGYIAIVDCVICGKEKSMGFWTANRLQEGTTCSKECLLEYRKKISSKRVIKGFEKNNRNMKTGCGITTDGYVWINVRGISYNNQIKLHRYIMQVHLGRSLRSDEIVHHKDGNKLNNALENLEITTISEHNRKHGHFRADNRDDTYSDNELSDMRHMTAKEFVEKYPNRTKHGFYVRKSRLKRSLN